MHFNPTNEIIFYPNKKKKKSKAGFEYENSKRDSTSRLRLCVCRHGCPREIPTH